jgi:cytochrome c biogenesis protein CcdA
MIEKNNSNDRIQKSLNGRFLFVVGILLVILYLVLATIFIFWKKLQLPIEQQYRTWFGVLLIVYAIIRFVRLVKNKKHNQDEN